MPHNLDRSDVDLAALARELGTRLGRSVALSARPPGQIDEDGKGLPGVLAVLDPATGAELDVDGRTVAAVVRAHVPPPPTKPVPALTGDEIVRLRALLATSR